MWVFEAVKLFDRWSQASYPTRREAYCEMKGETMASPVTVLADYTEPSGGSSDILSRFDDDVKGIEHNSCAHSLIHIQMTLAGN